MLSKALDLTSGVTFYLHSGVYLFSKYSLVLITTGSKINGAWSFLKSRYLFPRKMVDPTLAEMGKNLNEAMKMLEDNQRYMQRITTAKPISVCAKGRIINVTVIKQERTRFPGSLSSYCHSEA